MEAAERLPAASCVTARYSTSVPSVNAAGRVAMTRGVVSSAVPSGVHAVPPTTRHAKEVSCHTSSTVAATGTVPSIDAPAVGAVTVRAGVPSLGATVAPAASTTAVRAGTVIVTTPAASATTGTPPPCSGVKVAPGVSVVMLTVASAAALLSATRCSTRSVRSTRENA